MLVQMTDATHIRAEMVSPAEPQPDFTSATRAYAR